MKWRRLLIYFVTIAAQMGVLFFSYWYKPFSEREWPIAIAVLILVIGIIGGFVTATVKRSVYAENPVVFWWVNILGSLFTTVGVFFVFIPVYAVLKHSSLSATLFILGFLAPIYIPYLINMMVRGNA